MLLRYLFNFDSLSLRTCGIDCFVYSRLAGTVIHCVLCVWRHRNVCSSRATL